MKVVRFELVEFELLFGQFNFSSSIQVMKMDNSYETFEESPQNDYSISGYDQISDESNDTRTNIPAACHYSSFLSIFYKDFKLGISYYHSNTNTIGLLHEICEYDDFNITKIVLKQFEPTDVIISSKCDTHMIDFLKSFAVNLIELEQNSKRLNDSEKSDSSIYLFEDIDSTIPICFKFNLHIISSRHFQNDICRTRILSTNLPRMRDIIDNKKRFIYLSSYINFSEVNTVNSLGAILFFIEKKSFHLANKIENFVYFNLHSYVTMDRTTFEALEVFQQEWHPSVSKKGIYKREGLSLFGIFNTCSSKIGSYQLKKIFQQPITNYDVLVERFDTIDFFIEPSNTNLKVILVEHLKNIKDISGTLKRLDASAFILSDFQLLFKIASSAILIRNSITKYVSILKLFEVIVKNFSNELEEIVDCLNSIIDFEKSGKMKRFEINKNIDTDLDYLKSIFNKLPKILNNAILGEIDKSSFLSQNIDHISCVYIPQLGFLLALPLLQAQMISDIVQYDLELVFCANDKAYYKNSKMKEFDTYFGDIKSDINDKTYKLLFSLKDFILKRSNTIITSIRICAKLDSMIAMAQMAINYNYVRPKMTCYGQIKIKNGRHPLYELISNSFTPNHCFNGNESGKISIIFGPNGCGKTVYLKQVSLIVYLAHIGSFVPAESAEISIVNQIFTRILTPESISTNLSSFKHDLDQMIMATKYATQHSLVAIDFFGKGTLSTDGYSLLFACIDYWIRNKNMPHILISTQFELMSSLFFSTAVRFYTFKGINSFQLILCHNYLNYSDYSENCTTIPMSNAAIQASNTNLVIFPSNQNNIQDDIVRRINIEYKHHLAVAHFILNEEKTSFEDISSLNELIIQCNNNSTN